MLSFLESLDVQFEIRKSQILFCDEISSLEMIFTWLRQLDSSSSAPSSNALVSNRNDYY